MVDCAEVADHFLVVLNPPQVIPRRGWLDIHFSAAVFGLDAKISFVAGFWINSLTGVA